MWRYAEPWILTIWQRRNENIHLLLFYFQIKSCISGRVKMVRYIYNYISAIVPFLSCGLTPYIFLVSLSSDILIHPYASTNYILFLQLSLLLILTVEARVESLFIVFIVCWKLLHVKKTRLNAVGQFASVDGQYSTRTKKQQNKT